MFNTNHNKINTIKNIKDDLQSNTHWLQQAQVNNNSELSNQYAHICQQHKQDKKWVLFINPEESSIEELAQRHGVDVSKILMVNYKNQTKSRCKIELAQIKTVLSKGNCSAVILSNAEFNHEEVDQLAHAANEGRTQCVVIKKQVLH